MENNTNKITIRSFVTSIFRNKIVIILTLCIGTVVAYIGVQFQTPKYEASVKMHIKGIGYVAEDFYQGLGARRIHGTQIQIVKSEPVLRRVVEALNLDNRPFDYEKNFCKPLKYFLIDYKQKKFKSILKRFPKERREDFLFRLAMEDLLSNLNISLYSGSDIFQIAVTDYSPSMAVSIANVISRAYTIVDQQQQLVELNQKYGKSHPSVMQLKDNINLMTRKLSGEKLSDLDAIGTASVKIIEQARANYTPIGKPKMMILLVIIGVSFGLGVVVAFGYDNFIDKTFKSPEDIVASLNVPFLGSIPKMKLRNQQVILNEEQINLKYLEFIEDLADQFYVFVKNLKLHSVVISSALRGEGCTNTISNLAILLSRKMSFNTLLIDANFINPNIHKLFNLPEGPGLAHILESDDGNTKFAKPIHKVDAKLDIITAGKTIDNPLPLMDDSKIKSILKYAKQKYDLVLIDSTNLSKQVHSAKLSELVDGVALVVSEGKVRRQIVQSTIGQLRQKNSNIFGVVLNNRTFPIPKIIYNRL